jgi:hypothetical protein
MSGQALKAAPLCWLLGAAASDGWIPCGLGLATVRLHLRRVFNRRPLAAGRRGRWAPGALQQWLATTTPTQWAGTWEEIIGVQRS